MSTPNNEAKHTKKNDSGKKSQYVKVDKHVKANNINFTPNKFPPKKHNAKHNSQTDGNKSIAPVRRFTRSTPSRREIRQQDSHSAKLLGDAIKGEHRYAMLGLILGLASIIGAVILCIHGVTGSTSWSAKLLMLSSEINDAVPGVVLFIVGLFIVYATKPKVDLDNLKG